jgi:ABC-type glycerol-3-phosphate transport system substrate-binding protein
MVFDTTPHRRISRRQALTAVILPAGAVALLSACGGSAVGTATSAASAPAATSAVSTASTPAATAATTTATSSSSAAATTTAATVAQAQTTTAPTTQASTANAPASKAVQLTYMSPDSTGRHEVEQAIYDDFAKANAGVTVQIVSGGTGWSTLEDKLKTTMAGGTPPDLYQDAAGYWADVQSQLVELSGLLAQAKLDPKQVFALPAIQTFTDQAGKIWALPLVGISQDALAYNQDLFDSAGLAYPPVDPNDQSWTMDKLLDDAQRLTKADQSQFGFGGTVGGADTGGMERPTYFGQQPWDDATHKGQLDQPGATQGLQFFKDLRDRYKVAPTAAQVKAIGATGDVFTSGRIGMQVVYGYVLKLNFKWGLAALPHSGSQNMAGRQFAQPLFSVKTPHADQSWALLKWLMVPANAARFPLSGHYAVSPVNGASDLAMQTYKEQVGVDAQAFLLMSQHSHVFAGGMSKYTGWSKVNDWLTKNFPAFDQGTQTAADYGKAATAYIDANLQQA